MKGNVNEKIKVVKSVIVYINLHSLNTPPQVQDY